jgi:hypothetical protein
MLKLLRAPFTMRCCGVGVADEAAAEGEEGFVDVGSAVVADEQSFELAQPGEGALDDARMTAESDSGSGALSPAAAARDVG